MGDVLGEINSIKKKGRDISLVCTMEARSRANAFMKGGCNGRHIEKQHHCTMIRKRIASVLRKAESIV